MEHNGKVIGVGCPKTGTTTLGACFDILGMSNLGWDEELYINWMYKADTDTIVSAARSHRAFVDLPWCDAFEALDTAFPGSKFILTTRKHCGAHRRSAKAHNRWVTEQRSRCGLEQLPLWTGKYETHNARVRRYFAGRPGDLLELCWEQGDGWPELCAFLGAPLPDCNLPHLNKTNK